MKSLPAQEPLPEKRDTKQQALQFLLSVRVKMPFSTLGFLVQLILQKEEIIATVNQKKERDQEKSLYGTGGGGVGGEEKRMSKLCPHNLSNWPT